MVTPRICAASLDGSGYCLGIYWIDGEVQYVKCVVDSDCVNARSGISHSIDGPSVGDTRIDGRVNVN